ncbi:hypothetical protein GCM10010347_42900 [Streptomyces cirratus]|uniref:Polymerase/histidinol phosphatase N-terminal domain-containing protein n=1 Tax=Streptomyces cirratus TaxID=68187 RepID=A0ABQ3EWA3_9ACTN|nr:hypothetical protein GCM10010347_42900 [Streptomyces cirratus]
MEVCHGLCDPPPCHLRLLRPYGASHLHDLVRRAAERDVDTLALTDRGTVTGAVRFAKAATEAGVRPVCGVDVAVEPAAP